MEKVIVFTQFADTVRYLEAQLGARGVKYMAGVTGDDDDPTSYAWRFSPVTGNLSSLGVVAETKNPSFLALHPDRRHLYAVGESGDGPLSRVWWSVTSCLARLRPQGVAKATDWNQEHARWLRRLDHTRQAMAHAQAAARQCDDEGVRWFAQSLDVGARFAEAMVDALQLRTQDDPEVLAHLLKTLQELEDHIATVTRLEKTDILGGDPGCWLESISKLRDLGSTAKASVRD